MKNAYQVWILRTDGILDQGVDPDGLPFETESRDEAHRFAEDRASDPQTVRAYIRECRVVSSIVGVGALDG